MNYHIEINQNNEFITIASFLERLDRDLCLSVFRRTYPDNVFKATCG